HGGFEGFVSGIVADSIAGPDSHAALVRVDLPCFLDPGSKVFLDFAFRARGCFGAGDNFDGEIWSERDCDVGVRKPGEFGVADECDIGDTSSAFYERELRFGEYLADWIPRFVCDQEIQNLALDALVASACVRRDDQFSSRQFVMLAVLRLRKRQEI